MQKRQKHIVLVNLWRTIGARGGTEKVFCELANALTQRNFKVTAICMDNQTGRPAFPLSDDVRFINSHNAKYAALKALNRNLTRNILCWRPSQKRRKDARTKLQYLTETLSLKAAIRKLDDVDAFIAFQPDSAFVLKDQLKVRQPVMTMFHLAPSFLLTKGRSCHLHGALAQSAALQVLIPSYQDYLHRIIPGCRTVTIPNGVRQYPGITPDYSRKTIINIARLSVQKRPELLIEAFSLLKDEFPDWSCEWWGETFLEPTVTAKVKAAIEKFKLQDRFILKGVTDDVVQKLQNASVFAFPSEIEGLPLALMEALSVGLPAVGALDCPSVCSLIRNGKNGYLTEPTPAAFAAALAKLMRDADLRAKLGARGKADMASHSSDSVWDKWENLINELT